MNNLPTKSIILFLLCSFINIQKVSACESALGSFFDTVSTISREISDNIEKLDREVTKYIAEKDLKKLCHYNTFQVIAPEFVKLHKLDRDLSYYYEHPAEVFPDDKMSSPWLMSLFPHSDIAEKSYQFQSTNLRYSRQYLRRANTTLLIDSINKPYRPLTPFQQKEIKKKIRQKLSTLFFDKDKFDSSSEDAFRETNLKLAGIPPCIELVGLLKAGECADGLDKIKEMMNVKYSHALPQLYEEILTNNDYQKGLKYFAKQLAHKIKNKNYKGNLFKDMQNAFLHEGFSQDKAYEYTWNTIGLLSTAGPNIVTRLSSLLNTYYTDTADSLALIALALPVMDANSLQEHNQIYSYPPNIKSQCNQGKPYHFWMSAYLARELRKSGISEASAAAAVFIIQKAYQMLSNTQGRDSAAAFMDGSLSPSSIVKRIDMNYSAAASKFGSESVDSLSSESFDVDAGIKSSIQSAEKTESMSRIEAEDMLANDLGTTYIKWSEIFQPNDIFKSY